MSIVTSTLIMQLYYRRSFCAHAYSNIEGSEEDVTFFYVYLRFTIKPTVYSLQADLFLRTYSC